MAVENLIALPIAFADRDPAIPGSGTPFDAAHFNPNFEEIEAKYNNHRHSEFDTFALVGDFNTLENNFNAHTADTTAVHGITDTSLLVYTDDARLSDMRVPTDGSVTNAKVAPNAAISYNKLNLGASVQLTDLNFVPTTLTSPGTFLARTQDAAGTLVLASRVGTDANDRFAISTDGTMQWGSGAAPFGTTNLYRSGGLKTDGSFFVGGSMVLANFDSALKAESADVATRNFIFAKLGTDTVDRFTVDASGKQQWGGGAVATDTNLYRSGAASLHTDGGFVAGGSITISTGSLFINGGTGNILARNATGSNTVILATRASTDTQDRFQFDSSGKMQWGSGASVPDINLYRGQTGKLRTDGEIQAKNSLSGAACGFSYVPATAAGNAFRSIADVDVNPRFVIDYSGKTQWGDGTSAVDTNLYRIGASSLKTDGHLTVGANLLGRGATSQVVLDSQNSSTNTVFAARVSGDAYSRVAIRTDGLIRFGTGAVDLDTNLYRSGASQLKTDNEFIAAGPITTLNSAGGFYARTILNASTNAFSVRLGTDTVDRLNIMGDGKHQWGDGTNPADVFLYRGGSGMLRFGGSLYSSQASGTNILRSSISGDTFDRFQVDAAGKVSWGGGTGSCDTFLYRASAGQVKTDNGFQVGGSLVVVGQITTGSSIGPTRSTSSAPAFYSLVTGDTNNRFQVNADGSMAWGNGASAADVFMSRGGTNILNLGSSTQKGTFYIFGDSAPNTALKTFVTTDTNPRFAYSYDGKLQWGTGAGAFDVSLYRGAAGQLKTDSNLYVVGTLTSNNTFTLSGTEQMAAWNSTMTDTAAGAVSAYSMTATIQPTVDSAAEFRTLNMSATIGTPSTHNFSAPIKGAHIEARWQAAGGTTGAIFGVFGTVIIPAVAQSFGVISEADGVVGQVQDFSTGPLAGTITTAAALKALNAGKTNVTINNAVGVDVNPQTNGTSNYGVRIYKSNTASLLMAGTDGTRESGISFNLDTWLYRSSAGVLKTDGQLYVAGVATFQNSLSVGQLVTYNKTVDPGVSGANQARTYLRDNGSGKLQLVIQFPTGAPIVLATEA